jgi:hypothetical protein
MIALGCVLVGTIALMACDQAQNRTVSNAGPSATKATVTGTPTPTPLECGKSDAPGIRAHVYNVLEENKDYIREEFQWNISVTGDPASTKKITIIGWSKNYVDIRDKIRDNTNGCDLDIESKFTQTRDELMAIDGGRYAYPQNCQQGCVPCGDICLCDGTACKVTEAIQVPPAPKAAINANSRQSAAPSNSGSNSNTNSAPANSKPR